MNIKYSVSEFDTISSEFDKEVDRETLAKDLGISRCIGCYFFDCRCSSGLESRLLDDPTQEGYDND